MGKSRLLITVCFWVLCSLMVFNAFAHANDKHPIIQGVQYRLIQPPAPIKKRDTVEVIEFFSYGCPWCYLLEPALEEWIKQKPKYVHFTRVPVTFEPGWDMYARAYYTAQALDLLDKVTPAIFKAIHDEHQNLRSVSAMQQFFEKLNVKKKTFLNIFQYSPSIDLELAKAPKLMQKYQVYVVPSIVVNGRYRVNVQKVTGGPEHFIKIIEHVVEKARKESQ